MNNLAFFFQGDTLLLPADFPDSQINMGVPLELAKSFKSPDIFEIPPLDNSKVSIQVVSVLPEISLPKNWKVIPVRQLIAMSGDPGSNDPSRILRACHIVQWRMESRFCGSCGAENIYVKETAECRCSKCKKLEFPRICPAVIVVITNEDKILLAHNKKFKAGVYSLIAGFNEAGETLEETVEREIYEEVNIKVRDITYIKSQPWPFPNSLMVGFKARYSAGTIRPDGVEIEDAAWFTKDNLPAIPGKGSLSYFLIHKWLDDGCDV